jgi:hypothetical protein
MKVVRAASGDGVYLGAHIAAELRGIRASEPEFLNRFRWRKQCRRVTVLSLLSTPSIMKLFSRPRWPLVENSFCPATRTTPAANKRITAHVAGTCRNKDWTYPAA